MDRRGFYAADTFDRDDTLCFYAQEAAPLAYDDDTCLYAANKIGSSISLNACDTKGIQGTTSATYTTMDALSSLSSAISNATSQTALSVEEIGKALKKIGDKIGLPIDKYGRLVEEKKIEFKNGRINRLQRGELKTL